jgi:hypothetical protein
MTMAGTDGASRLRWWKALANGLLAWVIGFALYMIPSLVVAFKMGFELGPQGVDSSTISSQISQAISSMYRESLWLTIGYTVVVALLVFWRARVVAKGTGTSGGAHGLLVGAIPALLSLLSLVMGRMDLSTLVDVVVFLAAGYIGGRWSGQPASPLPSSLKNLT